MKLSPISLACFTLFLATVVLWVFLVARTVGLATAVQATMFMVSTALVTHTLTKAAVEGR